MDYRIEAETKHRIRIRIGIRKLSEEQAKILKYAFSHAPGVSEVTVYKASAGCAIAYTGDRSEIIRRLNSFNFDNVQMMAERQDQRRRNEKEKTRSRAQAQAPHTHPRRNNSRYSPASPCAACLPCLSDGDSQRAVSARAAKIHHC